MSRSGPSARTIIELNVAHYRNLLKDEEDPSKRQIIAKLLAEEEAKLAKLLAKRRKTNESSTQFHFDVVALASLVARPMGVFSRQS